MSKNTTPGTSWQNPCDFGSESAVRNFQIMSALARMAGATLVQVTGVEVNGKGTVDVQPLVNQMSRKVSDAGVITPVGTPHGILHGVIYWQPQSGISAVELLPTKGDIGLAIFADRDISKVVSVFTGRSSPDIIRREKLPDPGSQRMNDMSDGMYLGAFPGLNAPPTQFIKFDPASGITITTPIALTVNSPSAVINVKGDTTVNTATVEVNATTSATVTAPTATVNASTSVTVTTPQLLLNCATTIIATTAAFLVNGTLTVSGLLSFGAGITSTGGGAANMGSSSISTTGDITSNGKILATHTHPVSTAPGTTGTPS